jgi:hypothetical protein
MPKTFVSSIPTTSPLELIHRGSNAQTRMHAAEVVIREVQSDGSFQMRQLLAERIGKPRQSPHLHSYGQVLPLDVRRANVLRVRIASPHLGYNLDDWAWGVPPSRIMLPVVAVQLHQLREIYVQPKAVRHSSSVKIDGLRMRSARSCRT